MLNFWLKAGFSTLKPSGVLRLLKLVLCCTLLFSQQNFISAQVAPKSGYTLKGRITDKASGQAIPFATVLVSQNQSLGTTCNEDGNFSLSFQSLGEYNLIVRAIGYKAEQRLVRIEDSKSELNVALAEENYTTSTVEIIARKEDPAYAIIRKAMEKRATYLKEEPAYQAKVYLKGLNRIYKAPKKILGIEVEIPAADSNNGGVVYLSEAFTEYHFAPPDKEKEITLASKVSGNPRTFSVNSYRLMKANFYQNLIEFFFANRGFVSPISRSAMTYYRYKLVESVLEDSLTVHKIEVIPKRENDPAFRGFIYIQEGSFRIHGLNLYLLNRAGLEFVDTVRFKQVFKPVGNTWLPANKQISVAFSIFGIEGDGYFMAHLDDYQLNPKRPDGFFNREVIRALPGSNLQDPKFWDSLRTIPLTPLEIKDYQVKDSLHQLRTSKPYMDSLDERSNRLTFGKLFFGYFYRNRYQNFSLRTAPIYQQLQYNTMEGWVLDPIITFRRSKADSYKEEDFSDYSTTVFSQQFRYGFSSNTLFYRSRFQYEADRITRATVRLLGGRYPFQFNGAEPITELTNSLYTLLLRENYLRLFVNNYAGVEFSRELSDGLFGEVGAEWNRRETLNNTSEYSVLGDFSRPMQANAHQTAQGGNLIPHELYKFNFSLRWLPFKTYVIRPNGKYYTGDKNFSVRLNFSQGWGPKDINFSSIKLAVADEFNLGLVGTFYYTLQAGRFLANNNTPLPDRFHFLGNQTLFPRNNLNSFLLMPYYFFSNDAQFAQVNLRQEFGGFWVNKVPLLRKTKWTERAGLQVLFSPAGSPYIEAYFGIDNILKILAVDYAFSPSEQAVQQQGIRIRIGL